MSTERGKTQERGRERRECLPGRPHTLSPCERMTFPLARIVSECISTSGRGWAPQRLEKGGPRVQKRVCLNVPRHGSLVSRLLNELLELVLTQDVKHHLALLVAGYRGKLDCETDRGRDEEERTVSLRNG